MVNTINPAGSGGDQVFFPNRGKLLPQDLRAGRKDSVSFGNGKVSSNEVMQIVTERSMAQLRAVVGEARAELGLPDGAVLDTSPEATANRIADFALNFFGRFAENNKLGDNEEGRRQFADFIGKAINQGISEARNILGALQALNPSVESNIDKTAGIIQQRLEDFVLNGRG